MSSYQDLQLQIAALSQQAESIRRRELTGVIAEIRKTIHEYGISAEQLGFYEQTPRVIFRKSNGTIKYRDPQTGKTWGGIGARPIWLREYENAGGNKEDFKI